MLRTTALLLATTLLAAPAAFAETKTYDFRTFTKLDIAAGYEVIFTQGPQRSVTIESDDFTKVEAEQRGDTLRIGRPKNTNLGRHRNADTVRITAPDLDAAELNAGVKFSVDGLNVDDLTLDVNAGVEADFRRVKAHNITIDANAGVKIGLAGECQNLRIEAAAGVELDAKDLRCRTADVEAEVGSSVRVHAIDSVVAEAGLGASIRVAGSPKDVQKHSALGGSVSVER